MLIDTDTPRWGGEGILPEGRAEWDVPLEMVEPHMTQLEAHKSSMLIEAQKHGIHWVSQLWDGQVARWKEMEEREGGEMERRIRARWREVLEGEGGRVQPHWDPVRHGGKGNLATTVAVEIHTQAGVRADRSTEYSFGHAAPILRNESSNIVWANKKNVGAWGGDGQEQPP